MPTDYKLGHIKARAFYGYSSESEALLNAAAWAYLNDAAVIAVDITSSNDDELAYGVHLVYEV